MQLRFRSGLITKPRSDLVKTRELMFLLSYPSGGNSGSQAATLVIRALTLDEGTVRDWRRIVRREMLAGLALGSNLGAIGFMRIARTACRDQQILARLLHRRTSGGMVVSGA